ncbi:kinase-like protein [Polyplosphaeria fusca]|uniref:Kinase-like protein n=1 Tax=Polyplosphaeria fusca TaxID=682080 RepID=A0A9P4R419_9PLEO|nr:kinase-like protein [Polyplosphaeria fusca]
MASPAVVNSPMALESRAEVNSLDGTIDVPNEVVNDQPLRHGSETGASTQWTSADNGAQNTASAETESVITFHSKFSRRTFLTAQSRLFGLRDGNRSSTWSFATASSFPSSIRNAVRRSRAPRKTDWRQHLETLDLIPDEPDELNWSGRGQHVEFEVEEADQIPLLPIKELGRTANALVESVKCRRILLARKTINCQRKLRREDAIREVEHLQHLKHTHILQVVGTYTFKKNLSILLYPVAEYNLTTFLTEMIDHENKLSFDMEDSARKFFGCLSSSLHFIHKARTKHLDIKPMNILVKDVGKFNEIRIYKVIIADFGIARRYGADEDLDTGTPVSFTRTYAAPEVIDQSKRGLSADIFSLGCVFAGLLAALANVLKVRRLYVTTREKLGDISYVPLRDHWAELREARFNNEYGDSSYQANSAAIYLCIAQACGDIAARFPMTYFDKTKNVRNLVLSMLNLDPILRPTAESMECFFDSESFFPFCDCTKEPDPFEAAPIPEEDAS